VALFRITYSEDMQPGGKTLRVWHLGYRTDFGLPGFSDPFDMCALIELVLVEGLLIATMISNAGLGIHCTAGLGIHCTVGESSAWFQI
jgi:hypothetical protein